MIFIYRRGKAFSVGGICLRLCNWRLTRAILNRLCRRSTLVSRRSFDYLDEDRCVHKTRARFFTRVAACTGQAIESSIDLLQGNINGSVRCLHGFRNRFLFSFLAEPFFFFMFSVLKREGGGKIVHGFTVMHAATSFGIGIARAIKAPMRRVIRNNRHFCRAEWIRKMRVNQNFTTKKGLINARSGEQISWRNARLGNKSHSIIRCRRVAFGRASTTGPRIFAVGVSSSSSHFIVSRFVSFFIFFFFSLDSYPRAEVTYSRPCAKRKCRRELMGHLIETLLLQFRAHFSPSFSIFGNLIYIHIVYEFYDSGKMEERAAPKVGYGQLKGSRFLPRVMIIVFTFFPPSSRR